MSSADPGDVDRLLADAGRVDPVASDLGTPQPAESEAARRLIVRGPSVVPRLIEILRDEATPSRRLAYGAFVLGRIGDARAHPILRELRDRLRRREPKDEWDHAVIGQCTLALEAGLSDADA